METSGPASGIPRLPATHSAVPVQWRVGQVLHATVADIGVGKALLAVGNRQLSAETSLALQKGEQLMLQVKELGDRPVLKLVAATTQSPIAAAARQLLPAQGALPPLLASIGQLARSPEAPVPPLVGQLMRSMVKQMPDVPAVSTARGLKQAVMDSGVFLEPRLYAAHAAGRPVRIESDFKGNLLRLVQLVRNWPGGSGQAPQAAAAAPQGSASAAAPPPLPGAAPVPQAAVQASLDLLNRLGNLRTDLLQQTEAALARVQLHQLAALPRESERGLLEWLFELPLRHGGDIDLWSMRIVRDSREQQQDTDNRHAWSVQLAFDLPGLGALRARVQLTGERVSTRFWAEQPETLPLLRGHLHELREALAGAGLEVGELDCHQGVPAPDRPGANEPLITEKA